MWDKKKKIVQLRWKRNCSYLSNSIFRFSSFLFLCSYRQTVETVDFNNFTSCVVTGTEMRVVWAWIPERFALFSPVRLFNTAEHGRNLASCVTLIQYFSPVSKLLWDRDLTSCHSHTPKVLMSFKSARSHLLNEARSWWINNPRTARTSREKQILRSSYVTIRHVFSLSTCLLWL